MLTSDFHEISNTFTPFMSFGSELQVICNTVLQWTAQGQWLQVLSNAVLYCFLMFISDFHEISNTIKPFPSIWKWIQGGTKHCSTENCSGAVISKFCQTLCYSASWCSSVISMRFQTLLQFPAIQKWIPSCIKHCSQWTALKQWFSSFLKCSILFPDVDQWFLSVFKQSYTVSIYLEVKSKWLQPLFYCVLRYSTDFQVLSNTVLHCFLIFISDFYELSNTVYRFLPFGSEYQVVSNTDVKQISILFPSTYKYL